MSSPVDGHPAVSDDGKHVDVYGYTSMLLATIQVQQRQLADLKERVEQLEREHPPQASDPAFTESMACEANAGH